MSGHQEPERASDLHDLYDLYDVDEDAQAEEERAARRTPSLSSLEEARAGFMLLDL